MMKRFNKIFTVIFLAFSLFISVKGQIFATEDGTPLPEDVYLGSQILNKLKDCVRAEVTTGKKFIGKCLVNAQNNIKNFIENTSRKYKIYFLTECCLETILFLAIKDCYIQNPEYEEYEKLVSMISKDESYCTKYGKKILEILKYIFFNESNNHQMLNFD